MMKPKPPKVLDAIPDVVLAYRPKPKTKTRTDASTDARPFGEGPWSKFRLLVVVLII